MTLSRGGCARLWESAQKKRPDPWEGRWHCLGCPIGAANAGKPMEAVAIGGEEWRLVCARCRQRADRLIRSRWCVSCFNRQLEAEKGRNRKGSQPRLCAQLHAVSVAVGRPGQVEMVTIAGVIGPAEAMVQIARGTQTRIAFGAPGQVWDNAEASIADELAAEDEEVTPRSEDGCDDPCGEREPRRPTFRAYLLASTHGTWPALASIRARQPASPLLFLRCRETILLTASR